MVEIAGLGALQAKLGYRFRDIKLLKKALVHKSLVNESDLRALDSNERLEFLGDAALGLVVTEFICERFPDKLEGDLTALRAAVVNLDALAARAEALDLGEYVATGRGGILDLERSRRTVLGRSFEAVVGAAYVDGGIEAARTVLIPWIEGQLEQASSESRPTDPKSRLQMLAHEHFGEAPSYQLLETSGPDHDRWFRIGVSIAGRELAEGEGASQQRAEQQAAERALSQLDRYAAPGR